MSVFSVAAIAASFWEIPTGLFSDRVGKRETVTLGCVANITGIAIYGFSDSFLSLCLGSVFIGLGRAAFSGNNEALLYDSLKVVSSEAMFPKFLGYLNAMLQLGLALSAVLGGLVATYSMTWTLWISIVPQLVCLLLSFALREVSSRGTGDSTWQILKEACSMFRKNRDLRLMTFSSCIQFSVSETLYLFSPAFIASLWPVWGTGVARMLTHTFGTISFVASGRVIERLGALPSLMISQGLSRVLGVSAAVLSSFVSPLLLSFNSLLYGIGFTSQQTLLHEQFTDKQRATMGSLNSLVGAIAFSVVAYLLGLVADLASTSATILAGELCLLGAIAINIRVMSGRRKEARRVKEQPALTI